MRSFVVFCYVTGDIYEGSWKHSKKNGEIGQAWMCVVCVPCCCISVLNYCSPSCFATQPGQGATTYINGMCCEMYHSACSQSACLHSVCDTYSLLTMLCMVCVFVLALSLSLSGQGISTKVSIRMASRMDKAASHM